MEKLRTAFCDDDPAFRALLRRAAEEALGRAGIEAVAEEYGSAETLTAAPDRNDFDLIFLDIDMPGQDGILLGERLRQSGCRADIIYVSNMEERVYEIFRVHPWSFVRKSRFAEEMPGVLAEYARTRPARGDQLLLPGADGRIVAAEPEELVYAEAVGKTQRLVFAGERAPVMVRSSLRELEERLGSRGFIRVHKGFLVNYRFIRKITSRCVLLDTGGDVPVGRDRVSAAREQYLALMKWRGLNG